MDSMQQQTKVRQLGYRIIKTTTKIVTVNKMKATAVGTYDIEKLEEYLNADYVSRKDDTFTFKWRV